MWCKSSITKLPLPPALTLSMIVTLSSALYGIDMNVDKVPVSIVVEDLRIRECAAVSFIDSGQRSIVSLNLRDATAEEVLSKIAAQSSTYRSEKIAGRDVLYPAAPEFQAIVSNVDIQRQPRQEATEIYVGLLRRTVPALSGLIPPVLFGDSRMPIYSDKVTLRPRGRVIEHFVDLLGEDHSLYFSFVRARSGLPSLDFERLSCEAAGGSSCVWLGASGGQLLEQRVDDLSLTSVKVEAAVVALSSKANLPLSFIQTDPEETVSLDLHESTVRQALDAIVARAPDYRYAIVSHRLVLYPRDPKWEIRLDDVHLGPGPRIRITQELASELSRRLSAFTNLGGPWVGFAGSGKGKAYTYEDLVSVAGPGSIIELLIQLLGNRPSTYFFVVKEEGWLGSSLSVSSRDQLQSLTLTAAATTLHHRDQQTQLKLIGTLRNGGVAMDLTSGACGTVYKVSDDKVLSVNQDGLVTVKGNGTAQVTAELERSVEEVTIKVDLPVEPSGLP
jgi:hypothetical protein